MKNIEDRVVSAVQYTWVFPNMSFASGMDLLWIYEAYPISVNSSQVFQSICVPPETAGLQDFDKKISSYYQRFDNGIEEDIPALVNQQRGLASSDACQGRFQPLLEANVASFAKWYADQLLSQS